MITRQQLSTFKLHRPIVIRYSASHPQGSPVYWLMGWNGGLVLEQLAVYKYATTHKGRRPTDFLAPTMIDLIDLRSIHDLGTII